MKTGIPEFLPEHKQEELKQIIELVETKFKKVDMIILYGSYARGTWVEDIYVENGTTFEYISDYDLLFVMNSEKKAKTVPFQNSIEGSIANLKIETPIGFIYHGYPYIVKMLEERRYFFCDVYNEGYILSNRKKYELKAPQSISYELRAEKSEEYFEESFEDAERFFRVYELNLIEAERNIKFLKNAIFELHQATERFYFTIMLVFTDYKPKIHNIEKLAKMACDEDKRFREVFPMTTAEEERLFNLLKSAYIGSRYHKNFKVNKEELEYLAERVQVLRELTEKICKEKIEYFKSKI